MAIAFLDATSCLFWMSPSCLPHFPFHVKFPPYQLNPPNLPHTIVNSLKNWSWGVLLRRSIFVAYLGSLNVEENLVEVLDTKRRPHYIQISPFFCFGQKWVGIKLRNRIGLEDVFVILHLRHNFHDRSFGFSPGEGTPLSNK